MATLAQDERAVTVIQRFFRKARPGLKPNARSSISNIRERIQLLKKQHPSDWRQVPSAENPRRACNPKPGTVKPRTWKDTHVHDSVSTTALSATPRKSILSFLDEMDDHARSDLSIIAGATQNDDSVTVDAISKMRSKTAMLEVEVDDKRQSIAQLRSMLEDQKARTAAAEKTAALIWEQKMQKMKDEGEKVCERQLKMCDRLMQDKTQLTAKCSQLAEDFAALRKQYESRIDSLQQDASKELARQRGNWTTQEKMRREQWEKDRTKEIKEMTIKGLEPEVERILNERKLERRRLEEQHQNTVANLRLEMQQLIATKIRETKELCHMEEESRMEKEYENMQRKLREERQRFDSAIGEERSKCAADLQQQDYRFQKERLAEQHRAAEQQKELLREMEAQFEERIQVLKRKIAQNEDQHEATQRQLRGELETRKVELEAAFAQRVEVEKSKIEQEMRQRYTHERDTQLEAVVEKLGREAFEKDRAIQLKVDKTTEEMKKDHKRELRQQMDLVRERELEAIELRKDKEVVTSQKEFLEQELKIAQQAKSEMELELANMKAAQKVREGEIRQMKSAILSTLQMKEDALAENKMRGEEAMRKASEQLEHAHLEHQKEMQAVQEREQGLLENAEDRIKRALATKDDQIHALQEQLAGEESQVAEFKYLLQRQREELLGQLK